MNIDSQENNNYTHNRNGSKASLMEISENVYTHNRNTSKSNINENGKYSHNRNESKTNINNITNLLSKRIGTARKVKINYRRSSLQKNNLDSNFHKTSYSNFRTNSNSDFVISTRESSLLYNNNNVNSNSNINNSNFNSNYNFNSINNITINNTSKDLAILYSNQSRENLNYLYPYQKHSPTSPRDVNLQNNSQLGYKNSLTDNQNIISNGYRSKTNVNNSHYSPTSSTPISPIYSNSRENYYNQKENKHNNYYNSQSTNGNFFFFFKKNFFSTKIK